MQRHLSTIPSTEFPKSSIYFLSSAAVILKFAYKYICLPYKLINIEQSLFYRFEFEYEYSLRGRIHT